jgi:hypothetical protein
LWTLLAIIGFAAAFVGGGGIGLVPLGALAVMNALIFGFSLRYLHLHQNQKDDEHLPHILLAIAAISVCAWLLSDQPSFAAGGVVIADFMGLVPTLKKTWRDPKSEPTRLWVANAVAMALGVASLQHFTLASTLFPAYILGANCSIIVLSLR